MSNAILEAIRTSSAEERREALEVLQREVNGEKKKVPLPLDFQIGDDEEVMLDENGFPVLSPELEAEIRQPFRPEDLLSVEEAMELLEEELQKQPRSR